MIVSNDEIYLDNSSTTRIDPRVLEAMLPYLQSDFGNAVNRNHSFGRRAAEAVDRARSLIADAINAASVDDIIFTSGATESINLALKGLPIFPRKNHIVTTSVEHKAVLGSCHRLKASGMSVTYLTVDRHGLVDLEELANCTNDRTYLVSIIAANNEIGTVQDLEAIGRICRGKGVLFHTDATQAVGTIPFDVRRMCIDLASFTAHKIYGPKGVGALYMNGARMGKALTCQIDGAGQEYGLRSGTINVPGIVGFAKALELCASDLAVESSRITLLRDRLRDVILRGLDNTFVNGHPSQCLPGLCNISFGSIDANSLMSEMDDVAVSPGAACRSGQTVPSHVLKAIGLSDELAQGSLRFSVGRFNTEGEIIYAANRCVAAVLHMRAMADTERNTPGE